MADQIVKPMEREIREKQSVLKAPPLKPYKKTKEPEITKVEPEEDSDREEKKKVVKPRAKTPKKESEDTKVTMKKGDSDKPVLIIFALSALTGLFLFRNSIIQFLQHQTIVRANKSSDPGIGGYQRPIIPSSTNENSITAQPKPTPIQPQKINFCISPPKAGTPLDLSGVKKMSFGFA